MLKKLALLIALSIVPTGLMAQGFAVPFSPMGNNQAGFPMPGFSFGGMPGEFQNGAPSFYQNGTPNGYSGAGQSPNWANPLEQYGGAAPSNALQAQPTPFWMQTPQPNQPPVRYLDALPQNQPAANAPTGYTVFTQPRYQSGTAGQITPPRWAPLSGQPLPHVPTPAPTNNWSITPALPQITQRPVPDTPPKWPPMN